MSSKSATFIVPTRFTAIDAVSPVVQKMKWNINSMTAAMEAGVARQERLFRKLSPSIGDATKNLIKYGASTAAIMGAAFTGKSILDYETAIQSLQAVTGVSNQELAAMKEQVESLADKTHKSAIDVAGSFEVIGSAMSQYLDNPKALSQISEAGITLAKASRTELVPTLENLTSIMNQFNLSADKATNTVNRLTAGEIVGSLKTGQVATSLQEFGAGAYTANVSLAESVALVEALGKQVQADKIGVAARNILIVMDSAKGISKKARKELHKTGVSMSVLMNRALPLGDRLKELSKVMRNQTAAVKVFGHENVTAAQVIFNQLGTYEAYLKKIKVTDAAQQQAATNSKTFAVALDQLKNTFINYVVTGDGATSMLSKLTKATNFLRDNIDTIITVGSNALKFFALWKVAILTAKAVTFGYSVAVGIQNALMLESITLVEGNIVAKNASIITEKLLAMSIAVSTGNLAAFNAALAISPMGAAIVGTLALAGAFYYLSQKTNQLTQEYQKKIDLDVTDNINKETDAVKKLVAEYWHLGLGIKDATVKAIQFRLSTIDYRRNQAEKRILETKTELATENSKLYVSDLFKGATGMDMSTSGRRGELNNQLVAQQQTARELAASKVSELQFAESQVKSGVINAGDLNIKGSSKTESPYGEVGKPKEDFRFYEQLVNALKANPQKVQIEFKNAPAGTTVSKSTTGGIQTANSY